MFTTDRRTRRTLGPTWHGWRAGVGVLLLGLVAKSGCHGDLSKDPPVHPNLNMDHQAKFEAQEANPFFGDQRGMRPQVKGTVARGELQADKQFYHGRVGAKFAENLPLGIDLEALKRGQTRYNIYCAPCHGLAGTGAGIVAKRGAAHGMVALPDFSDARLRAMPVGQIFDVISNGARSMPAYRSQIPVRDRWLIVAYVRALQFSRSASVQDVPPSVAEQMGWLGKQATAAEQPPPKKQSALEETRDSSAAASTTDAGAETNSPDGGSVDGGGP